MEARFLLWLQEFVRNPILDRIMITMTRLGDNGIFWIILALFFVAFKKTRRMGICCFLSMIFSYVSVNIILKNVIGRIRPYDAIEELMCIIEVQPDFSFPSGHSSISFACLTVIFLMVPKKTYAVIPAVIGLLICFSRMYVGVHYPTDILGGILLGILCGLLAYFIVNKAAARRSQKDQIS